MADDVLFEKRPDGVALITLNRPDSLNAMGGQLMSMLADYLAQCVRDGDVRCVVLTGAGRAFCAGGDVKAMGQRPEAGLAQSAGGDPSASSGQAPKAMGQRQPAGEGGEGGDGAPRSIPSDLEERVEGLRQMQMRTASVWSPKSSRTTSSRRRRWPSPRSSPPVPRRPTLA